MSKRTPKTMALKRSANPDFLRSLRFIAFTWRRKVSRLLTGLQLLLFFEDGCPCLMSFGLNHFLAQLNIYLISFPMINFLRFFTLNSLSLMISRLKCVALATSLLPFSPPSSHLFTSVSCIQALAVNGVYPVFYCRLLGRMRL